MPHPSPHKNKSLLEQLGNKTIQRREVTCVRTIEHSNPHERIKSIGSVDWEISQEEAIKDLQDNPSAYFVTNIERQEINLVIGNHNGRPYLKTQRDGESPDNLLNLKKCQ